MERGGPDVFLSYTRADEAAVLRVAERLRAKGIEPWLDRWYLSPGGHWQVEIAAALGSVPACAVFVGPGGVGDWSREELGVAHNRAAKDHDFRLFPVLLPGAPDPQGPALAFLRTRKWVDLRPGLADPEGLDELACAIRGVASPRAGTSVEDEGVCPYRGLERFEEEHAEFFFGRADDVTRVLEKLRHSPVLGVLGSSGSGKSSLLRAGVIPRVRAGALPGSDTWAVRVFAPGARPLAALVAQVAHLFGGPSMGRTLDELGHDTRALGLAVTLGLVEHPGHERVLLVVDQFEELFTLCPDEAERRAFVANLLHAATDPGGRVAVVVALRADFYHRCADYPELASWLAAEQFLVGPLDAEGLRQAIEGPARRVGLEPEAGLVRTILDDVAERPGTLPLLEHVLLELWRRRRGGMLTGDAYDASGRVEGALARRADAVYEDLSPPRQELARRVLLRLVQPAEGAADTRRRALVAELARPQERADVDAVVGALADQRLLTTGRDEVSGAEVVDITHEALIRGWPRLRDWIDEDREALGAQRRLAEAASEWEQQGHDEGLLYRGASLASWQDRDPTGLNQAEATFLDVSRRRQARERGAARRRLRLAVGGLTTAVVLVSAVAVVAIDQGGRARQRADVAQSRQLAANARAALPTDPELGLLLARQAYRIEPTDEAGSALRQATLESRVRAAYRGHQGAVSSGAFSPDGQLLASAGDDATVRVWDRDQKVPAVVLRGHEGPASSVAFSPDGERVVSAAADGTVRVWDRTGAGMPIVLSGHQGPVTGAAFSPDGASVASAAADATVRVWDWRAGAERAQLRGHEGPVNAVSFSADGRLLVSAGDDGTVRLWDLAGQPESVVLGTHTTEGLGAAKPDIVAAVRSAAFSSDGRRVVSGGDDLRIWDRAGQDPPEILAGMVGRTSAVSFSPDGKVVVQGNDSGTVLLWEEVDSSPIQLHGHQAGVRSATFSPDGSSVLSASSDGTLRLWQPQLSQLDVGGVSILSVDLDSGGQRAATGDADGTVRVWDLAAGTDPVVLGRHETIVSSVSFSPDGEHVVSTSLDGTATIWDLGRGAEPLILSVPIGAVLDAAFSPDGHQVVTANQDGVARIWDVGGTGEPVVLPGEEALVSAAFSPDGRLLVTGGGQGTLRVWDRGNGRPLQELRGHEGPVNSVSFSPDGHWLVSGGHDDSVRVWDLSGRRPPTVLQGHEGDVRGAAFSSDGQFVVSTGGDTFDNFAVLVWDWAHEAGPPLVLQGGQSALRRAMFVPGDDPRVFGAGLEGFRMWVCDVCAPADDVFELSATRVTRELTADERATNGI